MLISSYICVTNYENNPKTLKVFITLTMSYVKLLSF